MLLLDAIYRMFTGPFPDTTKQDKEYTMRFIELKKDDKYTIVEVKYKNVNPWIVVCQPGDNEVYLNRIYEDGWIFNEFLYYEDWNGVYNMIKQHRGEYVIIKTGIKNESN